MPCCAARELAILCPSREPPLRLLGTTRPVPCPAHTADPRTAVSYSRCRSVPVQGWVAWPSGAPLRERSTERRTALQKVIQIVHVPSVSRTGG
eukprot:5601695-Prymnesium_polylepis.2